MEINNLTKKEENQLNSFKQLLQTLEKALKVCSEYKKYNKLTLVGLQ